MRPGDQNSIENLFNELAPNYDLLNDLLSFGLHRQWKRRLLRILKPMPGEIWLDLCCGTGDLAIDLARRVRSKGKVYALDIASSPLEIARYKHSKQPWLDIEWVKGNALDTGYGDAFFDGIVMAFGLRNLVSVSDCLQEMRRISKRGSKVGILDFNKLSSRSTYAWFQKNYLQNIVVPIASSFGLEQHYLYIEKSLESYPNGKALEILAIEAGFRYANYQTLSARQMGFLLLEN